MTDNNIPLSFIRPDISFNLDLDTANRLAKVQSEIKLPTIDITLDNKVPQYYPEYQPKFDFEKQEVIGGKSVYEAQYSDNLEEAAKARQLVKEERNKDFNIANNLYSTTYTPIEQTKRYTSEDSGFIPGFDNEDFYYRQNWESKGLLNKSLTITKNVLGRVVTGAVLKFGSGFGYLGSMLGNIGQDDYWGKVADNGFSKALEDAEEWTKQNLFKVYKSANYDNKGFFGKLTDASFWQDDLADGLAFMGSAFIPMGILGKVGTAAKFGRLAILAEDLAATTKVGKFAQKIFGATRGAQITEGLASGLEFTTGSKNILGITGHLYSTASEAAIEATENYRSIKKELIANGLKEADASKIAGQKASQTFGYNMVILSMSNAFENKLVQKMLNRNKDGFFNSAMKIGDDLSINPKTADTKFGKFLQDNTWGKRMSFYGKQGVKGFVAEGLWEENAQLAVQRIAEGEYEVKEVGTGYTSKKKAGNFIEQLATQTYDAFTGKDVEAQTSIGIGSLIGVMGGVGTSLITRERRKKEDNYSKALAEYNRAKDNWLKNDVYETYEENGKTKYKLDDKKNLIIDPIKMAARAEKIAEMASKLNLSKETQIPNLKAMLERSAFTDFVTAHINNNSIDFLIDRLENWDTSDKETLAAYGFSQELQEGVSPQKFAEIAKDLKKLHSSTQDIKYQKPTGKLIYDEKKKVNREMTNDEAEYYSELAKKKVFQLQANAYHVSAILNEGFSNLNDEKFRELKALSAEVERYTELLKSPYMETENSGIKEGYEKGLKESTKKLNDFTSKSENKKLVEEFSKIKKEQLELTNSYKSFIDAIEKYSNVETGIKDTALGLTKEIKKAEEQIKPIEEPPQEVLFVIKGKNYYSQEEVNEDLSKGVITQEDLDNTKKKKENYDYSIINTGDKFQLQFGDKNVSILLDSNELAEKIGNNIKLVDGKFKPSFSGLTEDEIQVLTNIITELNKGSIIEPKPEAPIIEKTNEERINEILYSIKQLNDQYQDRVDNLLLNGASLEEAEMFAKLETPIEDTKALELLQKELAILTLDPTKLPIDLKLIYDDINKFTDLIELNNYLTGIDKGIQDLFKVTIDNKVKELTVIEEPEIISQPIELDPTDTSNQSKINAKKADIEKRRKNNLEDTGDSFDYVSSKPRTDGKFNAFYTITKESAVFDTYQEAVDWVNFKYDAELAKELYKEMLSGKKITEFTIQEQQILDNPNIFNQELRDAVEAELKALKQQEGLVVNETEITDVTQVDKKDESEELPEVVYKPDFTVVIENLEISQVTKPNGNIEKQIKNLDNSKTLLQIILPNGESKIFTLPYINDAIDNELQAVKEVIGNFDINSLLKNKRVGSQDIQLPEIETDISEKVEEINIENNILEDISEFTEPLAWQTAQKTANQEIEQVNGADKLNSKGLKILSSDDYSIGIGKLIQDLKDPTSYLSNKLKNDELELVLIKDKKEWFSFRNINQEQEEGVVLVLRDKEGNLEELEDSNHPIIFTVNKDAFKERYQERINIFMRNNKDVSYNEAKQILDQTYTDLNEAREKVLNGEEIVVKYKGFGPGVIDYNKEGIKKKVITPYPILKYFEAKDFSVGVDISVGSEKAGRPYITLNHDKGTKVYVGTALLKDAILKTKDDVYGSVLSYVQDMLNTKFNNQEEAKKAVSNIKTLVYLKDIDFKSTPTGIIVVDDKGLELSKDKIEESLNKAHLKINSSKLNKGSINISDTLVDYPTLLKESIRLIELPLQNKDGELVFRAYNSYVMFEIQKPSEVTEVTEIVEKKKTRGRPKKNVDLSNLNSGSIIDVNFVNKKENKKTDCNG